MAELLAGPCREGGDRRRPAVRERGPGGTARPDSDVDIGILYREDPPRTLAGIGKVPNLEEELTEVTDLPIQIVKRNGASVDLIIRVLRDGKFLVGHDSLQRVHFEVRSRNEFWDLEPYLRLYRGQAPYDHG